MENRKAGWMAGVNTFGFEKCSDEWPVSRDGLVVGHDGQRPRA